jgi:hypothetical protein
VLIVGKFEKIGKAILSGFFERKIGVNPDEIKTPAADHFRPSTFISPGQT